MVGPWNIVMKAVIEFASTGERVGQLSRVGALMTAFDLETQKQPKIANVLEKLPVQDRMQAELINKRWFNVARGKSWVNFNFLMSKDFDWVRKKLYNTDWVCF
ncbi:hypothetical protein DdX_18575 [Ditylenchus destructor]|uniref:Uncharacterized protein n=1 Tax=Ditylenchus destructor TaxID=166010 RepID=A0AAD4MPS6_9BILA|nr:hypothetical protein DdX_18575 [Ditylenchus destructor]